MAKYLVTGGAGFIGSHVTRTLLERGHRVTVLDNFDPYYSPDKKHRNISSLLHDPRYASMHDRRFDLVEGDIRDGRCVRDAAKHADCIIHIAAQAGVPISVADPVKSLDVNVRGTAEVLGAAKDLGIRRAVFISSSSVYGKAQYLPFDEGHPTAPVSPYGLSKLAGEHLCRIFSDLHGLVIPQLRYFTVYGPSMRPELGINVFMNKAMRNEPIIISGDGTKTRSFTFVSDIVEATIAASERGSSVPYNVGGSVRITIKNLVEKIITLTGSASTITHASDVQGDMEHTWAKNDLAREDLGWEPKVDIDEGLARFYEWLKSDCR